MTAVPAGEPQDGGHGRPAGFPIVGVGASAGGLAAFEAFLSGMPDSGTGMAFVLVQHLAPDHKSLLTDLVRRYTRMQVFEAEDGMQVRQDCAYIIPPNRDMAILNGSLQLFEPSEQRGHRLPIDFFFRSLAQDQGELAVCVVLSGTGSDGTLGARAVKGEGGLVLAQAPGSAEYDGMPRSVISTGLADYELPPAEMPAQIAAYFSRASRSALPQGQASLGDGPLKKVFVMLRSQTGHDFSRYKPNTIHRRIERRMAVKRVETLEEYVKCLQADQAEVQVLFRDLLIGVTKFFRDPEAFKFLEERVIPGLFDGKSQDDAVRLWVPGCSTGEEAYSLAILLAERMETLKQNFRIQIFATDIDARAIAAARAGSYPASIAADLSKERMAHFFASEPGADSFRVVKSLRDMLIFSEQDVVKDPPFSRLDLISCRNLMIYMGAELQKKLIPLFHYALNPGGSLFLGGSESVGEHSRLFETLDRKAKVYRRVSDPAEAKRASISGLVPPPVPGAAPAVAGGRQRAQAKPSFRELAEKALLDRSAPSAALVDAAGDILYLHGRFGLYLEPPAGESGFSNILKMAKEGLRLELATALHKAASSGEPVLRAGLRVRTNGEFSDVDLAVAPLAAVPGSAKLFLVTLQDARGASPAAAPAPERPGSELAELRAELRAKEEYLQAANEELQTSNEELKSSNEELQSVNEELQSTNEELETSKEELQSVNEELSTVNAELQAKVSDLSRANNDMNNLLAGTGIATVFVDQALRILRFNPAATKIINLIASDVGRPVGHIASNLAGYEGLLKDAQAVLDTLVPKEMEVQTREGGWYTMGIRPYRTTENVIEGVVLTFVDITEVKKSRDALSGADMLRRMAAVMLDSRDAVLVLALDGRILAWNPMARTMYGWSEAEALGLTVREIVPKEERGGAVAFLLRLAEGGSKKAQAVRRLCKDGRTVTVTATAAVLIDAKGAAYAVALTEEGPLG